MKVYTDIILLFTCMVIQNLDLIYLLINKLLFLPKEGVKADVTELLGSLSNNISDDVKGYGCHGNACSHVTSRYLYSHSAYRSNVCLLKGRQ